MANLREIRNRISSIQNTQQITKAMKMVAAAKLRKAQNRMNATRPFSKKLEEVVSRLVDSTKISSPLTREAEEIEKVLFIVVGSDKGLCGGFNNNLFKVVEKSISDRFSQQKSSGNLDMVCLGRKSAAYFSKRNYQVIEKFNGFFDQLDYEKTASIMEQAMNHFINEKYDKVYIGFNEFKTVISQNRLIEQVLPIDTTKLYSEESEKSQNIDYIFEPDSEYIIQKLLPIHLNMKLWRAVLESNAAEQGARMAAMDNATENAKDLEKELTLKYNQARQSAITTEISEIVSGAQALEES